jgi:hypothetical protein
MNGKKSRYIGLPLAIILLVIFILLTLILIIKTNSDIKKEAGLRTDKIKIRKEAPSLEPEFELPQLEDELDVTEQDTIEEAPELEEIPAPEMRLKDLPLEKLITEEEALQGEALEPQGKELKVTPKPHEIESLKKKGLIIY